MNFQLAVYPVLSFVKQPSLSLVRFEPANLYIVSPARTPKVNGLKEVCAAQIPQKLGTVPKAGDVTWPEKCKQTWAHSSISSVPFVLSIYKKSNI